MDWREVPHGGTVLIALFHGIGDNIFATPAIRKVRRLRPDLRIIVAVRDDNFTADVWKGNPSVDAIEMMAVRPKYFLPTYRLVQERPLERLLARTGATVGADLVVHVRVSRMPGWTFPLLRYPHKAVMIARELGVGTDGLVAEIFPQQEHRDAAASFLQSRGWDGKRPVVAVNRLASEARKRWAIDAFERLCDQLVEDGSMVVQFYTPQSCALERQADGRNAAQPSGSANSLGFIRTYPSVLASAALFERCAAVVSVDSGPMHIASAVGTPTVGIFPATSPKLFAPLQEVSTCLVGQPTADRVFEAVRAIRRT